MSDESKKCECCHIIRKYLTDEDFQLFINGMIEGATGRLKYRIRNLELKVDNLLTIFNDLAAKELSQDSDAFIKNDTD